MSRKQKDVIGWSCLLFVFAVVTSLVGGFLYTAIHFVVKFW